MTWGLLLCRRREDLTNFLIFYSSYPWSADFNSIPEYLEHITACQHTDLLIEKLFQKHELTFSDDVLALVDIFFAYIKLSKIYTSERTV